VSAAALSAIPAGTSVETTGDPVDGFYSVAVNGLTGWISGAFLTFDGPRPGSESLDQPGSAKRSTPAAATPQASDGSDANGAASGLIWPVSGGSWHILQGYDGSSHENESALWQYQYSLDLARDDGSTAGQPVIAPAAGTIRWFDPSTGGISIDIGNDHAVALFHVTVDPSLKVGQSLAQGSPIGKISGPGGPGFSDVAHVHLALWQTSDGGNWDRHAVPFVSPYTIDGQSFPDEGGSYQYSGYEFQP
jgi:murein DD-endopeptidase MepM/ murein hydrolase activator NlpD